MLSIPQSKSRARTAQVAPAPVLPPSADWRTAMPMLHGRMADLRAVERADAPALFSRLAREEVSRYCATLPATPEAFERFIDWSTAQRLEGRHVCFALVPHGFETAVGLFQVRQVEAGFRVAEWGFAIASAFWGTGLFIDAAPLVLDFVFGTLGAHRVEARAVAMNGRGNGALQKLGAVQEGVLRRAFLREGTYVDQVLWSILDEDWRLTRATWSRRVLVH
jgi:RimJ/RimL family protein N-acetyltransferase